MTLPQWVGWHLIGAFPDHEPDDVRCWLLEHEGEAMLLEVPEGLPVADVRDGLRRIDSPRLRYVTASHDHEDHLDVEVWEALKRLFPAATFLHPSVVTREQSLDLGGEPLWLLKAPKHSRTDVVTVFRGVAMTGDIELGMLESVND
jgi:glyoxylase-like metal-dependent hydrolase (beta-lactamase superfamily II)